MTVDTVDDSFVVRIDDDTVCTTTAPSHALARLLWEINQRAIERSRHSLLLHASAVERDGRVVLLAGRSGSGKSTLAAALVTAGFTYLTDDAVVLEAPTGRARPAVKPIALGRDVLHLFPSLQLPDTALAYMDDEWFVTPEMLTGTVAHDDGIRPRVGGNDAAPGVVVFPIYAPDADNRARRVTRAEALVLLADNSFNFDGLAPSALELLARVLRDCECYRFAFSEPAPLVEFVVELFTTDEATMSG